MKTGMGLAYEIYIQLKAKYSGYQFDDFISLYDLKHAVIGFKKDEERGKLKFMIEISTEPFKIYRREIDLHIPGQETTWFRYHEEYENILIDARKIAKGKPIS